LQNRKSQKIGGGIFEGIAFLHKKTPSEEGEKYKDIFYCVLKV
jgi:hypothetical protein